MIGAIFGLFTIVAITHSAFALDDNISYAGPYLKEDNNLTASNLTADVNAAMAFRAKYTNGFVTIFGGSKLKEGSEIYTNIQAFAKRWTDLYGDKFPILTGAGPGAMEAASRGAYESSNRVSIGYTTYYNPTDPNPDKAFDVYHGNRIISDGLIFSSVSLRETMMILSSKAIIITPGGSGTDWEIFQILEMRKSHELLEVPIYLTGSTNYWESFYTHINTLSDTGMLGTNHDGSMRKLQQYFKHAENINDAFSDIASRLKL